jgi:ABC-type nickel/cobalt efflux system permease component RcnA
MVLKMDNEDGRIPGLVLFFLMIIFGVAAYMWLTLPMSNGVAIAVTLFWSISTSAPDAAYQAGFQNLANLDSGSTIAMLIMILSGLSFLIVALRSKFGVS